MSKYLTNETAYAFWLCKAKILAFTSSTVYYLYRGCGGSQKETRSPIFLRVVVMKKIEKLIADSKEIYDKVGSIACPGLDHAKVHFTSDGFHHLIYTTTRRERPEKEQAAKLRFLAEAIELIKLSTTYQEYEERRLRVPFKRHGKTVTDWADVRYWVLIGFMNRKKIRVVIRRIGQGQFHFWSIVPGWDQKKIQGFKVSSTAKGDLEAD